MKKIIDFTILAILATAAAGVLFHFDVGKELTSLFGEVVRKVVPWVELTVNT
jgi:hypothetical protein